MNEKEKYDLAFEQFLEGRTYEAAEAFLFSVAAKAFEAGWLAAGGQSLSHIKTEDKYAFLRQLIRHNK